MKQSIGFTGLHKMRRTSKTVFIQTDGFVE